MGDYITSTTLMNKFSDEVGDYVDFDDDGTPDQNSLNQAIADAEATVNSYLVKRYDLSSVKEKKPPVVIALTLNMALYELALARDPNNVKKGSDIGDLYDRTLKDLEKLATGLMELDVDTVTEQVDVRVETNERIFTRETMEGY